MLQFPCELHTGPMRELAFMIDPVDALILDLLEWVANRERGYAEVMDAWRTSHPIR